jgi:hypothetical protein
MMIRTTQDNRVYGGIEAGSTGRPLGRDGAVVLCMPRMITPWRSTISPGRPIRVTFTVVASPARLVMAVMTSSAVSH